MTGRLISMALLAALMGTACSSPPTPVRGDRKNIGSGNQNNQDNNDSNNQTGNDPSDQDSSNNGSNGNSTSFVDPGKGSWELVPKDKVAEECGLNYDLLDKAAKAHGKAMAVVRFGKLCYESDGDSVALVHSVTKTIGGLTFGAAMMDSDLDPEDDVTKWGITGLASGAKLKHVLSMSAHQSGFGSFSYDVIGTTQINKLNAVIEEVTGKDTQAFSDEKLFGPLGIKNSKWSPGGFLGWASDWNASAKDMARIGLLMLNHGQWDGQQIIDKKYAYEMLHPVNEKANAGYGYLTWLLGGDEADWLDVRGGMGMGGSQKGLYEYDGRACYPPALLVCKYGEGCNRSDGALDIGVFYASGSQGQVITGHPGLDLVMTVRNQGTMGAPGPTMIWDVVMPALVEEDPKFKGDIDGFCKEYSSSKYAPNHKKWDWE